MKRKVSEQLGAISERLHEIWSELIDYEPGETVYVAENYDAADCIESAIGELEEARMKLAGSGR